MTSKTVYQYTIYCATEGTTVEGWSDNPPPPIGTGAAVCPRNVSHEVVAGSVFEVSSVSENVVKIDKVLVGPFPGQPPAGMRPNVEGVAVEARLPL